jgi:hypothetical protein
VSKLYNLLELIEFPDKKASKTLIKRHLKKKKVQYKVMSAILQILAI